MAGEWIPYDVCLPTKPEVLELVDRTGLPVDQVVGRLAMLWGWAALNCEDGRARISLRLLSRICGGDEAFWLVVQDVGWLEVDAEGGTVAIPRWDRRFSQAAKSRALAVVRHQVDKSGARSAPSGGARRPSRGRVAPRSGARSALERRERSSSSSLPGAAPDDPDAGHGQTPGWDTLRKAWKAGKGRPWQLPTPPDNAPERLSEDGWFEKALAAIDHLPACRYFRDPVTLPQFVAAGFVDKVLGGQFDNPRDQRPRGPDDRPPAQEWSGDDAARFEATKKAIADRLRREGAA
jgi:hypothetical protein